MEIVKRISHTVRINWKRFSLKFWLRSMAVFLCMSENLPESRFLTAASYYVCQRRHEVEMKIRWKANLLVFHYWFFFFFCHIWSYSLTLLKSMGVLPLIWPRPGLHLLQLFSSRNGWAELALPELNTDKEDTDDFQVKFWDKEPVLSSLMAVRLQPNLNCFVCCRVF